MSRGFSQKEKAIQFQQLHQADKPLVLPNIWDVLGAKLLERTGYPAVATASAAIAFTHGYPDGEKIPFGEILPLFRNIAAGVNVPVTADIESGYTADDGIFREHIVQLLQTGIAGINLEDTDHASNTLYPVDKQCQRIQMVRELSEKAGIPLFINARADVVLYPHLFSSPTSRLEALITRGLAYREAGANGFFPIALRNKTEIREVVEAIHLPVNILTLPGVPDLQVLKETGVARISLGSSFLKTAMKAMKSTATQLKNLQGLNAITENEITTDYLNSLIHH